MGLFRGVACVRTVFAAKRGERSLGLQDKSIRFHDVLRLLGGLPS
jgi:hypothetical protein